MVALELKVKQKHEPCRSSYKLDKGASEGTAIRKPAEVMFQSLRDKKNSSSVHSCVRALLPLVVSFMENSFKGKENNVETAMWAEEVIG